MKKTIVTMLTALILFGCDSGNGTTADTAVTITAIQGVTAPATGASPISAVTETAQFTGTVEWSPEFENGAFKAETAYTATITLTPKTGYTLEGVTANFFTVAGAATVSNAANSGIVIAVFPATEPEEPTNQAPTANAGNDFEHNITTSGATITLNGSGTDTDGTIAGYAWTCTDKPNGSATPTFSNSTVANPTVSGFDTLGNYEFSLKVTDNDNAESTADVVTGLNPDLCTRLSDST